MSASRPHLPRRAYSSSPRQAFTLIELLLVLAILGTLMAMTVPNLMGRQETANIDVTQGSIAGVEQALQMYQLDHQGKLPTGRDGLRQLVEQPSRDPRWRGPYLEEVPRDAWGQEFTLVIPGKRNPKKFDIVSPGPDQIPGTDDDVGNW